MDAEDDPLDVLWDRVLEDWDNAAAHDAFLQMAYDREQLGRAAGRYRSQLEEKARRDLAEKKLSAVAMLAMQTMDTNKTEPRKKAPRWLFAVAALLCAGGVAVLAYAFST